MGSDVAGIGQRHAVTLHGERPAVHRHRLRWRKERRAVRRDVRRVRIAWELIGLRAGDGWARVVAPLTRAAISLCTMALLVACGEEISRQVKIEPAPAPARVAFVFTDVSLFYGLN